MAEGEDVTPYFTAEDSKVDLQKTGEEEEAPE